MPGVKIRQQEAGSDKSQIIEAGSDNSQIWTRYEDGNWKTPQALPQLCQAICRRKELVMMRSPPTAKQAPKRRREPPLEASQVSYDNTTAGTPADTSTVQGALDVAFDKLRKLLPGGGDYAEYTRRWSW